MRNPFFLGGIGLAFMDPGALDERTAVLDERTAEILAAGRPLRTGLGTGKCECGKTISQNKASCLGCSQKGNR